MINLSLDELRLIAQIRNISDYENKSKEDLIKALSEPKPETKPKPKPQTRPKQTPKTETKPKQTPKTETKPKPETKPKETPKPKPKIKINKKKLEEIEKDFYESRRKFSKNEIKDYRKVFYIAKNYKHLSKSEIKKKKDLLSKSEIEKTNKNLSKLKKSLMFKKFRGNIDSVDYEGLDNYDDNYDFADDDKYRKIGSIRTLFKEIEGDYYKPIRTDSGFAGRNNNYIEYTIKGERCENLSPKVYLNMTIPYLRDLINEHKPTDESNDESNNDDIDRAESKIQLTMQNICISTKRFEETRTIYTKSEPLEVFMGSDTEDVIDKLFNTLLQRFQHAQETSNERGR